MQKKNSDPRGTLALRFRARHRPALEELLKEHLETRQTVITPQEQVVLRRAGDIASSAFSSKAGQPEGAAEAHVELLGWCWSGTGSSSQDDLSCLVAACVALDRVLGELPEGHEWFRRGSFLWRSLMHAIHRIHRDGLGASARAAGHVARTNLCLYGAQNFTIYAPGRVEVTTVHMEAGSQAVLRPIAAGCDLATFPGTEEQFYFEHAVEVMADSLVLMTDWVDTAPVPEATPSIMDVMQVVFQQAVIGSGLTVLGSLGASPAGALGWDIRIFKDRRAVLDSPCAPLLTAYERQAVTGFAIATAVRNVAAARAAGETRETTTLATDDEWRIVLAREAACARKWGPGREANRIPASAKGLGVNRAQWVFNVWVPRLKKSVTVCRWHVLEEALMWYEQNANKVFAKALSERITVEELKQFACAL